MRETTGSVCSSVKDCCFVGVHKYTIVVCQYEKNENLHYTLKVFSIVPIVAMKEIHPLPHTQQLTGQWDHTNCESQSLLPILPVLACLEFFFVISSQCIFKRN